MKDRCSNIMIFFCYFIVSLHISLYLCKNVVTQEERRVMIL